MLIKILEQNIYVQVIHQDLEDNACKGEEWPTIEPSTSISISAEPATSITILLKGNNQGLIALVHNLVFHTRTKYIDIKDHYICDEIVVQKIKLSDVPTSKIIVDSLTKVLTHVKFHGFIAQIKIT